MNSRVYDEKCQEVFALLSDYLNLELPPEACSEIQAHLAGCAPCIEFTESLRKTVDLCRQYTPVGVPEEISQKLRDQLLTAYRKSIAARSGKAPQ